MSQKAPPHNSGCDRQQPQEWGWRTSRPDVHNSSDLGPQGEDTLNKPRAAQPVSVSGHVTAPASCTSNAFNCTHNCRPIGGPVAFDSQGQRSGTRHPCVSALPASSRDTPTGRKFWPYICDSGENYYLLLFNNTETENISIGGTF
jgi:hypothetical protein